MLLMLDINFNDTIKIIQHSSISLILINYIDYRIIPWFYCIHGYHNHYCDFFWNSEILFTLRLCETHKNSRPKLRCKKVPKIAQPKNRKHPTTPRREGKNRTKKNTPTAEKPDAYSRLEHRCKQQDQQQHTAVGHQWDCHILLAKIAEQQHTKASPPTKQSQKTIITAPDRHSCGFQVYS